MHPSPRTPSDAGPEAAAHSPGKGQTGIGGTPRPQVQKGSAAGRPGTCDQPGRRRLHPGRAANRPPQAGPNGYRAGRHHRARHHRNGDRRRRCRPALGHPPPVQHLAVRSPGRAGHQPVGDERSAGDAAEPASVQDLAHRPSRDRAGLGLRAAAAARPGRGARQRTIESVTFSQTAKPSPPATTPGTSACGTRPPASPPPP